MQTKYYPKSSTQTFGIATVTPDTYDPSKKYMTWIVGAGIGERGDGSEAALQKLSGWGGFGNIKSAVDKYDYILVFVNTANNYEKGEYQYALSWAEKNLSVDPNNICVLTHSLGGYGAGNYGFSDAAFTSKINIWFNSASGPYSNSAFYQNLVNAGVKVWGVTAANDTISGTNPKYVTQVYDKLKVIDPDNDVMVVLFPSTTWPDGKIAHNAVLGRLTGLTYTGIDVSMFSGKTLTAPPKMNIYEWAKSNPKGSIYQKPDHAYTGPVYPQQEPVPLPEPTPTAPVYLSKIYIEGAATAKNLLAEIIWSDAKKEIIKAPTGVTIQYMIPEVIEGRLKLKVKFSNKSTSTPYGPTK